MTQPDTGWNPPTAEDRVWSSADASTLVEYIAAPLRATIRGLKAENAKLSDALEFGWTIICNAGEGSWERESIVWQSAAAAFREQYYALLADGTLKPAARGPR